MRGVVAKRLRRAAKVIAGGNTDPAKYYELVKRPNVTNGQIIAHRQSWRAAYRYLKRSHKQLIAA